MPPGSFEYKPEKAFSLEAGTKMSLLNNTADVNVTVFRTKFDNLQVSIFDGTNYWDGTAFTSATELFQTATSTDDFANWSYAFSGSPGSYTVRARFTDAAANNAIIDGTAAVT